MHIKLSLNRSFTVPILPDVMHTYVSIGREMYTKCTICTIQIWNEIGRLGNEITIFVPLRHFETIPAPKSLFSAKFVPNRLKLAKTCPGIAIAGARSCKLRAKSAISST